MTIALRPSIVLYEIRTPRGTVLRVRVSPEIARILADDGAPLKETAFSDLPSETNGRTGLDPDRLDARTGRRRQEQRPMPEGNPWEGPRYHFPLLLGESRPGWLGGECEDAEGRCGVCHGAKLLPVAYCLGCQRCGRDKDIPGPNQITTKRPPAKFKPRCKTKMKASR
jgi:hypothetical protein